MTENKPPEAQEQPPAAPERKDSGRYAVYDETLLKFVSGVTTQAKAKELAKSGPKGHKLTVRKV